MCFFIYLIPYFKLNFIRFFSVFAYWRTRGEGGGGLSQKRTGAYKGEGGPIFSDFERTYFWMAPNWLFGAFE